MPFFVDVNFNYCKFTARKPLADRIKLRPAKKRKIVFSQVQNSQNLAKRNEAAYNTGKHIFQSHLIRWPPAKNTGGPAHDLLSFRYHIFGPVCLVPFPLAHRRQNIIAAIRLLSAGFSDPIRYLRGKLKRTLSQKARAVATFLFCNSPIFFAKTFQSLGRCAKYSCF
jgi:hypothetical protein